MWSLESKAGRKARMSLLAGVLALGMGMGMTGTLRAKELKVGEAFPDVPAAGLEGTVPDLKGKVVLVDFWASWCGPCKKAFPTLAELHKKYADRGFTVLAISLDEDKGDMDKFLSKNPVPFPVLRDADGKKLAEKLGIEGIPTSFVLGKDGKVAAVHSGFEGDKSKKAYTADIEAALAAGGK